jgi:hypothetical protein
MRIEGAINHFQCIYYPKKIILVNTGLKATGIFLNLFGSPETAAAFPMPPTQQGGEAGYRAVYVIVSGYSMKK